MRKIILGLAATVAGACLLAGLFMLGGSAHAAAGGPVSRPSAVTRTCHAFAVWNAHRTTANLNAMMVASVTTPYPGLGLDVEVLYGTVKLHDHADTPDAVHAVTVDCHL